MEFVLFNEQLLGETFYFRRIVVNGVHFKLLIVSTNNARECNLN